MKAILVIDMPKNCLQCPILCGYSDKCPLKPMPEKVTENVMKGMPNEEWQMLYDEGWNDCIKELEK